MKPLSEGLLTTKFQPASSLDFRLVVLTLTLNCFLGTLKTTFASAVNTF